MILLLTVCRVSELFDIISDVEPNAVALDDLKVSFNGFDACSLVNMTIGMHIQDLGSAGSDTKPAKTVCEYLFLGEFVVNLPNRISRRLLHPGAETSDIIEFYISMIRCLKVIDPQGVLLYRTADPIRSYLR